MRSKYDAVIIGAGPAGLACSSELADKGLRVAVLDEQAAPGGQIYRNIEKSTSQRREVLGNDYTAGKRLVETFQRSGADYLPGARVWQAESNGDVFFSREDRSGKVNGRYLVVGTGAMERPVPFDGWTLPGVMTCGGMSNLYKDSGLVPKGPVVLAGSGPLLWLVVEHLFALDVPVTAILDTTPLSSSLGALRHLPRAVGNYRYLLKGVGMIGSVLYTAFRNKVPVYRGVKNIRAAGRDRLEQVTALCGGKERTFKVNTLLVHEGIIPNTALLRQIGCNHAWNPVQRFWHPVVDQTGRTNLSSVFVAGDTTFVHGAVPAALKGRLTGLRIAAELNCLSDKEYAALSGEMSIQLENELRPRPFVDALYAPRKDLYRIPDEATVCRCEGITAGEIRKTVADGFTDHNEIKSLIRCGMGPCQGRMCGPAITELVAEASGKHPRDTRQLRLRPPIKPVSLQELANAQLGEIDES